MSRILVLGATGTIGGQVASQLLDAGESIRVGARTPAKAAALAARGAEVVELDFERPDTWPAALEGIERLFVVAPFVPNFATPVKALLQVAIAAGVKHVVKLSAMGVGADVPFALGRQHHAADTAVIESGLGYTILRPTFFMDNLLNFHSQTLQSDGAFYGASANQPISYVSSADVAAVGVAALRNPAAHDKQEYVLTGAVSHTDTDVAAAAGKVLGKAVQYVDLPAEQLQQGMASAGTPDWMVEALIALENVKAQGWASAVSPAVEQVLGRPPESYASFLARRA